VIAETACRPSLSTTPTCRLERFINHLDRLPPRHGPDSFWYFSSPPESIKPSFPLSGAKAPTPRIFPCILSRFGAGCFCSIYPFPFVFARKHNFVPVSDEPSRPSHLKRWRDLPTCFVNFLEVPPEPMFMKMTFPFPRLCVDVLALLHFPVPARCLDTELNSVQIGLVPPEVSINYRRRCGRARGLRFLFSSPPSCRPKIGCLSMIPESCRLVSSPRFPNPPVLSDSSTISRDTSPTNPENRWEFFFPFLLKTPIYPRVFFFFFFFASLYPKKHSLA